LVEGEEFGDENDMVRGNEGMSEEVEDFGDPKWEPEPVDAAPGRLVSPVIFPLLS